MSLSVLSSLSPTDIILCWYILGSEFHKNITADINVIIIWLYFSCFCILCIRYVETFQFLNN